MRTEGLDSVDFPRLISDSNRLRGQQSDSLDSFSLRINVLGAIKLVEKCLDTVEVASMFESELPKSADIIVVGSGVMGASVAFQLTRNGAEKFS